MIAPPDCDPVVGGPPEQVTVQGVALRTGSRVRLRPRSEAHALDWGLGGRTACIEGLDQDDAGRIHVAVTLDDDPGRDLGEARFPGHRFYFAPDELEPLGEASAPRILVAGIGNVFLGDDGFGVEVARQLAPARLGPGVQVVDFGIRGMDLVYALQSGYDAVVLVDACARGAAPGTLFVIEPETEAAASSQSQGHDLGPDGALALARALGTQLPPVRLVACEPAHVPDVSAAPADLTMELSPALRAALPTALDLVARVVAELAAEAGSRSAAAAPGEAGDGPGSDGGGTGDGTTCVDGTIRTHEGARPGAGADRAGNRRDLDPAPRDPARASDAADVGGS